MSTSTIAVIGGTGNLGSALAGRWIKAGLQVFIGSRKSDKAAALAQTLSARYSADVRGGSNAEMAALATIVVITVPFAAQEETINDIRDAVAGKLVVDTTVPLLPPKVMRVQLPAEGSAALRAQRLLGEGTNLVSAFHNVAAHKLAQETPFDCDVLVFGDDKEQRSAIVELAVAAGLRGIHGGALANSAAAEALTSVLIFINKTYSSDGAGVRITGPLKGLDD